jgi:PAS domain S-box-containing protein
VRNLEDYQKELTHVKEVLRANPRGMTVTDISREININRNSVAKYLDVLLISGQVEMKRMGPAKAYFLSHRVPISAMLNFSSDCILVFDGQLKIVQVNDIFLDLINADRDDIIDKKLSTVPFPIVNDPDILTRILKGLEGKDSSIEKSYLVDGADLYLYIKFIPTTFQDGSLGVTLIMENITARINVEKELRESEETLSSFMDSATDGFSLFDSKLNLININEAAMSRFGVSKGDIIEKNILELRSNIKETGVYDKFVEVMRTGEPYFDEFNIMHHKLGIRHLTLKAFKVKDGLGVISTDITERKRMEMALRESEERFKTICSNISDIVMTIDLETNFTLISSSVESILGYSEEEAMNKKLEDLLTPSSYELAMSILDEELVKDETGREDPDRSRVLELELNHKDGSTVVTEVKVTFLRDQDGKPIEILSVARDITERLGYRDKLEALHRHAINLALTSNIDEIAKSTLDAIELVFKVEDLEFIVAKDQTLQLVDRKGPGAPIRTVVPFDDQGVIAKVARTKSSILVKDVREDPDYFEARSRTLSELAVPVKINDDLFAVLNLESPKEGAFTLEDQKLLEIFAGHVASAMKRIESSSD